MELRRSFGQIREAKDDRTVKFVFSTGARDRHGTRISPDGWRLDNFNKNGIASYQHRAYGDPDPDKIIGPARAWPEDGKLVGNITFEDEKTNPLAEKLFRKVQAGTLNAVSVGFMEHDGHWGKRDADEDPDTYYFDDVELMEISLVSIPSNPEALAYREFEPLEDDWQKAVEAVTRKMEEFKTDLTNEVIKPNNMEKEEKKDLAPETSKVDVNVKVDASEFNESIDRLGEKLVETLAAPPPPELSEGDKKTLGQYSIAKAILKKAKAQAGEGLFDGIEREMHEEAIRESKRCGTKIDGLGVPNIALVNTRADLQATVDAAGGYTVATELQGFIDTLKNAMVAMRAGAQLMTGLEGDVAIPRLASNSTATWRSEGGVSTESDPTFEQVTMTPNRLTTYTIYSQQLLRQSSLDVERIVRDNLFYSIANALENAIFEGSGSSNEPTGILNATGVNDATHGSSNPTAMSWANIVNMEKMVAVDNALRARLAYVFDTQAAAKAKTTVKSDYQGGYIWENLTGLDGGTVNGYPAYTSNIFTNNTIIFGNFSDIMVGQWGGLDLLVNPYSLDTYAQIRVVIAGYYDVALKHGQSFARIDDSAV